MKKRLFILLIIIGISVWGVLYLERLNPTEAAHQKHVAETLQPFALSFGSLIAALGGLGLITDWLRRRQEQDEVARDWVKRFPMRKIGKTDGFDFIQREGSEGIIYIYDKKRNQKHWIANLKTLHKLWGPTPERTTLSQKEFDSIPTGENIDLSFNV